MPESVSLTNLRFEPKSLIYLFAGILLVAVMWMVATNVVIPYIQGKSKHVAALTTGSAAPKHPAFG